MQNYKNTRLDYLDYAKGIGIIIVVGAHLMNEGSMPFLYSNIISEVIYQFHMPLFFIISGFTIDIAFDKYGTAAYRKIMKRAFLLLAGYFLWSLIFISISNLSQPNVDYQEEFIAMVTLRGRAPIWFLAALSLAELGYLIMRYLVSFFKSKNIKQCIYIIIIIFTMVITKKLLLVEVGGLPIIYQYLWITITRFFPSLAFVIIGSILYRIFKINMPQLISYGKRSGFFLILVGFFLFFLVTIFTIYFNNGINMHLATFGNVFLFYINALLGSLAVLLYSKGICKIIKPKIIPELGKNSLGIMIFHFPPYFRIFYYLKSLCNIFCINNAFIAFNFCLCLSLLFTYIITMLIKKEKLFL
jgi:fucose 4-O-acetylase-like acetyltransferase